MSTDRPGTSRPELLAPAGDWEAMRAAVANGADAVYFGLSRFNARHRATNFRLEELPEVMRYLHGHNVRGYVAFNTLIFSDELDEALRFIRAIADAGADAVIVQDLGLALLISRMCPRLHVHGSTQMTLTEPLGIEFVKRLGVRRVILARELSLTEIRRIRTATDVPVEVFVHGALCVAYSGQCLTSESLGQRSANRGQCAQACRLPYELIVDGSPRDLGEKSYLLSPQDLAAYDLVSDLTDAGVCSFKIEGRLKAPAYVAATTQAYRAAIDAAAAHRPFQLPRRQQLDLAQTFSRGFTHGFLDGPDHQELVHALFPKSRGIRAGRVVGTTRRGILVEVEDPDHVTLNVGDGVLLDEGANESEERGGRVGKVFRDAGVPPVRGARHGRDARVTRSVVEIVLENGIAVSDTAVGTSVWKTDDPMLKRRLQESYAREQVARRVPVHAEVDARVGELLRIVVRNDEGHETRIEWDQPLAAAQKHPLTEATFREQFGRMGDSPFELAEVRGLETPSPAMVPKSVLNDLRRQAVAKLIELREDRGARQVVEPDVLEHVRSEVRERFGADRDAGTEPHLHVLVRDLEQLWAVLNWTSPTGTRPAAVTCDFEDIRKYKPAIATARAAGVPIGLATVRIIKPGEEGLLKQVADCNPDFVLVRNLAGLSYYTSRSPQLPLVADYALNIGNEVTAALMAEHGVRRMVPSYDLNWSQLSALINRFPPRWFEVVIHQHMPMFHMEHCVFCHTLSTGKDYRDCGRPCDVHRVELKDREGAAHPLVADVGCRNTVFNASAQSAAEFIPRMKELGLRHFRVELLRESAAEAVELLERYARVLSGAEDGRSTWRQLRVLNQLGITRGTLRD